MIATLRGELRAKEAGRVVIETGGVGYEVFIPLNTYYRLPAPGTAVGLQIRQIVRDEVPTLYGFADAAQKRAFDILMRVQNVGPKLALAVLSVLTPEDLVSAINRGDVARIDAVPGIGPKVAERVVRELRDKITELRVFTGEHPIDQPEVMADGTGAVVDDAISALVNLGYRPAEAKRAVDSAARSDEAGADLETLIRRSLNLLLGER